MKKSIFASLTALALVPALFTAQASDIQTQTKTIDRIQIEGNTASNSTNLAHYYFVNKEGWGAVSCPTAIYAYIGENEPGAEAMLKLAQQAKKDQTPVSFLGSCDSNGNYVRVTYMIFH